MVEKVINLLIVCNETSHFFNKKNKFMQKLDTIKKHLSKLLIGIVFIKILYKKDAMVEKVINLLAMKRAFMHTSIRLS